MVQRLCLWHHIARAHALVADILLLPQEVNVKGTYILAYYFIKTFGGEGTLIDLVSLGASFTAPGISSYSGSKLATIKLGEYLDLGNLSIASARWDVCNR